MTHPLLSPALARCPLIAILRGIRPNEVVEIGEILVEAGFSIIEIPLNSPKPFESIAKLSAALPGTLVGAGTVLSTQAVKDVAAAGGRLVVMPHGNPEVIRAAKAMDLACLPGIATPTEAFVALDAGADGLKLFPAELSSPAVLKAMRTVLPPELPVLPVGGITPENMAPWRLAGAAGFGLGSGLYRPGDDAEAVGEVARRFIASLANH